MADAEDRQKTEAELEADVAALMADTKKKKKDKKKDKDKEKKKEKKDKKKKDKKKARESGDEGSASEDEKAAAAGAADEDDATPAAAAAGDGEDAAAPDADEGDDAEGGAGRDSIAAGGLSDAPNETYTYELLLQRMYEILERNNPEYAVKKRYVMAPPQVFRVGSTRTCWANFAVNCGQMNRGADHVLAYFLAELGTEGSIDGSSRLMLKGRFVPKKIESLLRKYIVEYVTCEMCRSPDTVLKRDPVSRLYFVNCESCGASRAVSAIRAGHQALKRGQRRRERR